MRVDTEAKEGTSDKFTIIEVLTHSQESGEVKRGLN